MSLADRIVLVIAVAAFIFFLRAGFTPKRDAQEDVSGYRPNS